MFLSLIKAPLRPLYRIYKNSFLGEMRRRSKAQAAEQVWREKGSPVPPPHSIKQKALLGYGKAFGLATLIETGTFQGDMILAMRDHFKKIVSIELSEELSVAAREKFRGNPHVTIVNGDSGMLLQKVLADVSEPCLFWLDGHYSGDFTAQAKLDTPIVAELQTVLNHRVKKHVMLIDDARLFDGTNDYPTLAQLTTLVHEQRADMLVYVKNDSIRIHEPRAGFEAEY